jgi:hypothetical protein
MYSSTVEIKALAEIATLPHDMSVSNDSMEKGPKRQGRARRTTSLTVAVDWLESLHAILMGGHTQGHQGSDSFGCHGSTKNPKLARLALWRISRGEKAEQR